MNCPSILKALPAVVHAEKPTCSLSEHFITFVGNEFQSEGVMMKRTIMVFAAAAFVAGCSHDRQAVMTRHPGPGIEGPGTSAQTHALSSATTTHAQVFFAGPGGMHISWESGGPGQFSPPQITAPGRYNFRQGNIYRLKLTGIPGRDGVEIYPTLEIAAPNAKTSSYLSHNPVPISMSAEDIDQILAGNFLTKVVFLPDPQHQELAIPGVETLVSTRLEPGANPTAEADRRGTILAIIRVGNIDLETPSGNPISMTAQRNPIQFAGSGMMRGGGSHMASGYATPVQGNRVPSYYGQGRQPTTAAIPASTWRSTPANQNTQRMDRFGTPMVRR